LGGVYGGGYYKWILYAVVTAEPSSIGVSKELRDRTWLCCADGPGGRAREGGESTTLQHHCHHSSSADLPAQQHAAAAVD
jgi:hypothetical protein